MSMSSPESSAPQAAGGFEDPLEPIRSFNVVPADTQVETKISRIKQAANAIGKAALVAFELLPLTNETTRYGALAYAETQTQNPLVGAVVLGATTFAVEASGAIAAAHWTTEGVLARRMDIAREKVDSFKERLKERPLMGKIRLHRIIPSIPRPNPETSEMSGLTEFGLALTLGSVVVNEVKQQKNPARPLEQTRRDGFLTASWLAGYCAVEGALISEGLGNIADPRIVGPAAVAVVGMNYGVKKIDHLRQRLFKGRRGEAQDGLSEGAVDENVPHNIDMAEAQKVSHYDLSSEEVKALEGELVDHVREHISDEGVAAVLIPGNHVYADTVRNYEAEYFPEVKDLPEGIEEDTLFIAFVDTRPGIDRVVHATTITGYQEDTQKALEQNDTDSTSTNFVVVNDLIEMGNFTAEEFREYYTSRGVKLEECIAVETNFRVGERVEDFNGISTVDLAYLTTFGLAIRNNPELGEAGVFANINRASLASFSRVGLKYELLMGRDDMVTSESLEGKEYLPIFIPYSEDTQHLFQGMGLRLPELKL